MPALPIEPLSTEAFAPFGTYAQMIDPDGEKLGRPPIEFYRDKVALDLGGTHLVALSTCRVEKRPPTIDVAEYHTATGEGILPLDADVAIHVGPATAPDDLPLDRMRVFRVPRGTLVALRPGVWHHAPFVLDADAANVLIILPERTYAIDCEVEELAPDQQIAFGAG